MTIAAERRKKAREKRAKKADRRAIAPPRYSRRAEPLTLTREHFQVVASRTKRKKPRVSLDELVSRVSWERVGDSRTGELNFYKPLTKEGADILLAGDFVDLFYAHWGGDRRRLIWRMKVATPQHQIKEGLISVALRSDLYMAKDQAVAWKIKAGKRAHQVARLVARRFRIRVGRLSSGKHKLDKYVKKKAHPMEVVRWAYREERQATGRRFDVDTSRSFLEVLELRDPGYMQVFGPAIVDATVAHSIRGIASALIVTSTRRKKGSRKHSKIRVRVVDHARRRRYGYIVKTVEKKGLGSAAEARRWGKRQLARMHRPEREITFTHPGIPYADRGDYCTLYLPEDRLHQKAWVKNVRHDVSAGSYEMEVTIGFDDPYLDVRKARVKRRREAAEAKRKGRRARGHTHPKPKKAARRATA